MTNRHPADQLAEVRAEIATLEDREAALRAVLLAEGASLNGDEFVAEVRESTSNRVDTAALRKAWGDEKLSPFMKAVVTRSVRLKRREAPEGDEE